MRVKTRVKYWEIIADNLSKAKVGVGAVSQPWIPTGEQSGSLMRIRATKSDT
jgi:hypothetical protein